MKSGQKILHWDTPLPASRHRRHEDPTTSDNYGAIDRAAREPLGTDGMRANDTNAQAWWAPSRGRFVVAGMHWRYPAGNGYTRIKRRFLPGSRPMTAAELGRTNWTWGQVRRWRRPNGERPRTAGELYAYGFLRGVVQVLELKSMEFATHPEIAAGLVADARGHDHPAWTMVLDSMYPRSKVANYKAASGHIAIIAGTDGLRLPSGYDSWPVKPDRIWA
jgi:hypothetical protein